MPDAPKGMTPCVAAFFGNDDKVAFDMFAKLLTKKSMNDAYNESTTFQESVESYRRAYGHYTDVTGYYSTHFPHPYPPYVREATAHFTRNGKHYLVTSGTTGYLPNPSELAIADTWHGPYTVLGNPHPQDESSTSFHSQISSVFKVEGKKDLYIAVADRWCPRDMDVPYAFYKEMFEYIFHGKGEQIPQLIAAYGITPPDPDAKRNTSIADYVWLPFRFDGEMG